MEISEEKTDSEKDEYLEKWITQMNNWNVELDEIYAKIAAADTDSEAKLEQKAHVSVLRRKRDEAREKLADIQSVGNDGWEGFKNGMESLKAIIDDDFLNVKAKF